MVKLNGYHYCINGNTNDHIGVVVMPTKPKRPCNKIGCRALTTNTYCDDHKKQRRKQYDQQRGSAAQRGYDARWRKFRRYYLNRHPLCVRCQGKGGLTPATIVDHIVPHRGDYRLMWDTDNWQSLCKQCHDIKTATEDGGFGHEQADGTLES